MDQLDAITLLYLSKNWDGEGSLLDCAHKFQQTKEELADALQKERGDKLKKQIDEGTFSL